MNYRGSWSDEETTIRSTRATEYFYKVEKWTKDGTNVDRLLYAGNDLKKGAENFFGNCHAPAAHQVDHPATVAGAKAVAGGIIKPLCCTAIIEEI